MQDATPTPSGTQHQLQAGHNTISKQNATPTPSQTHPHLQAGRKFNAKQDATPRLPHTGMPLKLNKAHRIQY